MLVVRALFALEGLAFLLLGKSGMLKSVAHAGSVAQYAGFCLEFSLIAVVVLLRPADTVSGKTCFLVMLPGFVFTACFLLAAWQMAQDELWVLGPGRWLPGLVTGLAPAALVTVLWGSNTLNRSRKLSQGDRSGEA